MNIKVANRKIGERLGEKSEFRLVVDNTVKYLTIECGTYDLMTMCVTDKIVPHLPPLPEGDWNTGKITRSGPGSGQLQLTVATEYLPSMSTQHRVNIDVLSVKCTGNLSTTRVLNAREIGFTRPVFIKFAPLLHEIEDLEREAAAYRMFEQETDLRHLRPLIPRFLGNVTEHGRAIGFLLEEIREVNHAGPSDLQACRHVLGLFHARNILHGDICRYNILVRKADGFVMFLDLAATRRVADHEKHLLEEEMAKLEPALSSKSTVGYNFYHDK